MHKMFIRNLFYGFYAGKQGKQIERRVPSFFSYLTKI